MARLEVSPGEGMVVITPTSGGSITCRSDCVQELPRGSRVHLELLVRRPDRLHATDLDITLAETNVVRAEWLDRSGERLAGGLILGAGVLLAGGLVGGGVAVAAAPGGGSFASSTGQAFGAGVLFFLGGAALIAGAIAGLFHLLLTDRPVLRSGEAPVEATAVTPWVAPHESGGTLGIAGGF